MNLQCHVVFDLQRKRLDSKGTEDKHASHGLRGAPGSWYQIICSEIVSFCLTSSINTKFITPPDDKHLSSKNTV